jgi:hypothetical protein
MWGYMATKAMDLVSSTTIWRFFLLHETGKLGFFQSKQSFKLPVVTIICIFGQKLGFSVSPVWGDTLVSLLGYWVSYILYTVGSSYWHGCNSVNTQSLPIDAYDCIPSSCRGLQYPPVSLTKMNLGWKVGIQSWN